MVILKTSMLRVMYKNYVHEDAKEDKDSIMILAIGYSCCILAVNLSIVALECLCEVEFE